ncbi:hypothetical protein [Natronorubrum texcoconense]|uniref:Uncharacterized protein n=1 Tax=Natronorubrum texcoconense TaxID=1095776 RepID=A0A1G8X218_9EURY|nr:hypothetical protein [Natronorubrum texcoconense]SDJ84699.1 hypothetical protein SAMN04515672_1592 [Natronorubrum texcoconense]
MSEPYGQRGRVLAGLVLLALLFGCLVWAGATTGDLTESRYPDEVEVTPDRESYVGDRVVLGGFVVDTDPVVIATRASGYGRFTLVDADAQLKNDDGPLEEGDRVTAFGTLEDESTLVVERTTTRESSETSYMLLVSALGGLVSAWWFVRHWCFDRGALAFVPRAGDDPSSQGDGRSAIEHADQRGRAASDGGDRRG